jgi:hypothetical protein
MKYNIVQACCSGVLLLSICEIFEMGTQQKMAPVPNLENSANVTNNFQNGMF